MFCTFITSRNASLHVLYAIHKTFSSEDMRGGLKQAKQ